MSLWGGRNGFRVEPTSKHAFGRIGQKDRARARRRVANKIAKASRKVNR